MILYRALNNEDKINLYRKGMVTCSLINTYDEINKLPNEIQTKVMLFYNNCCNNINKKYILSLIYGHVNGKLVKAKRSPWISTTSDFFTAYDYARLYKCRGKGYERRDIICFEINDDLLINNITELSNKNIVPESILDLSGNKLAYYRMNKFILPFDKSVDDITTSRSCFMIGNYSMADSEHLVANYIKPNNYIILNPIAQDKLLHKYGERVTEYIEKTLCKEEYIDRDNEPSLQLVKKMI